MIGPLSVKTFSLVLVVFLRRLILPWLLEKQSLLVGLVFSKRMFFLTVGEAPLEEALKALVAYLMKSLEGSGSLDSVLTLRYTLSFFIWRGLLWGRGWG